MSENMLELRMMGFVPYNISDVQKSIQFGHAVVEYMMKYFNCDFTQDWAKNWKTFIILNGGTTNDKTGSLNTLKEEFEAFYSIASFREPDLNDALTAFVFIVDERVFNKKKYPDFNSDFDRTYQDWRKTLGNTEEEIECNIRLRELLRDKRLA